MRKVDTLVVGGGQAGLATSYTLGAAGREHLVLERAAIGETWRQKWDSFCLLTPNWSVQLPGFPLVGHDPDAFLTRDQIVAHLGAYAASFSAPIETGVDVTSVAREGDGFHVVTSTGDITAKNVVIATGAYPIPVIPDCHVRVPASVMQLHSLEYRNPRQLPAGPVLVVGSAQSGFQIADELRRDGREVVLSLGQCGWSPRSYRGRDVHAWLRDQGFLDHTAEVLASPAARFACTPNIITRTSRIGSFRDLLACGIEMIGRVVDVQDGVVKTAGDIEEILRATDRVADNVKRIIDAWIAAQGISAPEEPPTPTTPVGVGRDPSLDLVARDIRSIVWACGFRYDFSFIHADVFDARGFPLHERGVTSVDGLYFTGLPWLHKRRSSLLYGTQEDAAYIVRSIVARA